MSDLYLSNYKIQCRDHKLLVCPTKVSNPILVLEQTEMLQLHRIIQAELFGAEDQRRGFRVPLEQPSELFVTIDTELGIPRRVSPLNISFSGILVEFHGDKTPDFPIDCHVKVKLEYHQITCLLDGKIARRMESKDGIHFPKSIVDGELCPPEDLFDIVNLLEQHWMRTKAV